MKIQDVDYKRITGYINLFIGDMRVGQVMLYKIYAGLLSFYIMFIIGL